MRRTVFLLLTLLILLPGYAARMQDANAYVIVMDTRLRLHTQPSIISETVSFLDPVSPLVVIGRTADSYWLNVRAGEAEGWIISEFAEVLTDVTALPITTDLDALYLPYPLTGAVVKRLRETFVRGVELGNRVDVFAKVGDSITVSMHYLQSIGQGLYNLGDFQHLQSVIDLFGAAAMGDGINPFTRVSLAAGVGWTAPALLDPEFADPTVCQPGESPLRCEYRLTRPIIALIMVGTNDVPRFDASIYEGNLQEIVDTSLKMGVIPVISTIPEQPGQEARVADYNQVVRDTAERFAVPYWDFHYAMDSLPERGLDLDGIHPSIPPRGFKGAGDFRPANLYYGYVVRNLGALQMLETVRQALMSSAF